jgi:DNA-directed RNA polymerase subunit RPC12/RpoP
MASLSALSIFCFGSLAHRRRVHPGDTMRGLVRCPACGSDRLIPLTFGTVTAEDRIDVERRPVAKCADCGERTYVSAKAHRELSPD